jgi:hypothetical protein
VGVQLQTKHCCLSRFHLILSHTLSNFHVSIAYIKTENSMTLSMKLHYFGRGRISDSPLILITAPSQYITVTANHAGTEMGEENRWEGGGKEVVGTMRAIHVMNDSDKEETRLPTAKGRG